MKRLFTQEDLSKLGYTVESSQVIAARQAEEAAKEEALQKSKRGVVVESLKGVGRAGLQTAKGAITALEQNPFDPLSYFLPSWEDMTGTKPEDVPSYMESGTVKSKEALEAGTEYLARNPEGRAADIAGTVGELGGRIAPYLVPHPLGPLIASAGRTGETIDELAETHPELSATERRYRGAGVGALDFALAKLPSVGPGSVAQKFVPSLARGASKSITSGIVPHTIDTALMAGGQQMAENALAERPDVMENVGAATLVGGGMGAVLSGGMRALTGRPVPTKVPSVDTAPGLTPITDERLLLPAPPTEEGRPPFLVTPRPAESPSAAPVKERLRKINELQKLAKKATPEERPLIREQINALKSELGAPKQGKVGDVTTLKVAHSQDVDAVVDEILYNATDDPSHFGYSGRPRLEETRKALQHVLRVYDRGEAPADAITSYGKFHRHADALDTTDPIAASILRTAADDIEAEFIKRSQFGGDIGRMPEGPHEVRLKAEADITVNPGNAEAVAAHASTVKLPNGKIVFNDAEIQTFRGAFRMVSKPLATFKFWSEELSDAISDSLYPHFLKMKQALTARGEAYDVNKFFGDVQLFKSPSDAVARALILNDVRLPDDTPLSSKILTNSGKDLLKEFKRKKLSGDNTVGTLKQYVQSQELRGAMTSRTVGDAVKSAKAVLNYFVALVDDTNYASADATTVTHEMFHVSIDKLMQVNGSGPLEKFYGVKNGKWDNDSIERLVVDLMAYQATEVPDNLPPAIYASFQYLRKTFDELYRGGEALSDSFAKRLLRKVTGKSNLYEQRASALRSDHRQALGEFFGLREAPDAHTTPADVKVSSRPTTVAQMTGRHRYPNSQVVDESGDLKRVYHGTGALFDRFDPKFWSQGAGGDLYGQGFYLSESGKTASGYSGTGRIGVLLDYNGERLIRRDFAHDYDVQSALDVAGHGNAEGLMELLRQRNQLRDYEKFFTEQLVPAHVRMHFLNVENPFRVDAIADKGSVVRISDALVRTSPSNGPLLQMFFNEEMSVYTAPTNEQVYKALSATLKDHTFNISDVLQAAGFDGITHIGQSGARQWIVWDPDKILPLWDDAVETYAQFTKRDKTTLEQIMERGRKALKESGLPKYLVSFGTERDVDIQNSKDIARLYTGIALDMEKTLKHLDPIIEAGRAVSEDPVLMAAAIEKINRGEMPSSEIEVAALHIAVQRDAKSIVDARAKLARDYTAGKMTREEYVQHSASINGVFLDKVDGIKAMLRAPGPIARSLRLIGKLHTMRTAEKTLMSIEKELKGKPMHPGQAEKVKKMFDFAEWMQEYNSFTPEDLDIFAQMAAESPNPRFADYVVDLYVNGLLSGIKTIFLNPISNTVAGYGAIPHEYAKVAIDALLHPKNRTYHKWAADEYARSVLTMNGKGAVHGRWEGAKDIVTRSITRELPLTEKGLNELKTSIRLRAFKNSPYSSMKALSHIVEKPADIQGAQDVYYHTIARQSKQRELAMQQAIKEVGWRNWTNKAEKQAFKSDVATRAMEIMRSIENGVENDVNVDIMARSMLHADKATFMEVDTKPVTFALAVKRMLNFGEVEHGGKMVPRVPLGNLLMPFTVVSSNIAHAGLWKLNPVVQAISMAAEGISKGTMDVTKATYLVEGMGLWATGLGLYATGRLHGGYSKKTSEREAQQRIGWKPWALDLGGMQLSLDVLGYASVPLSMMASFGEIADAYKTSEEEGALAKVEEAALKTAAELLTIVQDRTYLGNLSPILGGSTSERSLKQYFNHFMVGFVPYSSFFREINRAFASTEEGTPKREQGNVLQEMLAVSALGPVLPQYMPKEKLNVWGKTVTTPGGLFNQWFSFASPAAKDDTIENEMVRIGWYPGLPLPEKRLEKNGKFYPVSDKTYRDFLVYSGSTRKDAVANLMRSSYYMRADDKQRLNMLERVDRRLRERSLKRLWIEVRREAAQD